MYIPNREELLKGCEEFERHERRDAMYKVATFLVSHFWGQPADVADGLGVLLLTWNQAFYRYGFFDFDQLERCIADNLQTIESFRSRDILSLSSSDEHNIKHLFAEFLEALQITTGGARGKKSPVAVAKALHLLAPNFFPLWDEKIAKAYGCYYSRNPAEKYVSFCETTRSIAGTVGNYIDRSDKTLVKLIDEYNYSKYTKKWI
jgi:hypothetical protein